MFTQWGLNSGAGGVSHGKVCTQHYAEWIQHWAAVPCAEYARQMWQRFQPSEGFADAWAEPYSVGNPITLSTNISPTSRDVALEAIRTHALLARTLVPRTIETLSLPAVRVM